MGAGSGRSLNQVWAAHATAAVSRSRLLCPLAVNQRGVAAATLAQGGGISRSCARVAVGAVANARAKRWR